MKVFALPLLWAVPLSVLAQPIQKPQPVPVAITHVTVIDATGAPAKPDETVVIAGDRITELGPANEVHVPKNARVVDATGKFLIPGLSDMHVHWGQKDYLPLFIANGVTGVRVMAGQPVHQLWRKEIEGGTLLGPRMTIASTIVDGPTPWWPNSIAVGSEAEARQAVINVKQDGADFVKVYWLLPREAYFAIADEAKKQGIPFAGHLPFAVSAAEASDAGQQSIEHFEGLPEACSTREGELRKATQDAWLEGHSDPRGPHPPTVAKMYQLMRSAFETFSPEKAATLFARLKRNHTWVCPTLRLYQGLSRDPNSSKDDPRVKYLPPELRTRWFGNANAASKERTSEDLEMGNAVFKRTLEIVRMMRRGGVEFLAGTDVPVPYGFPGFTLHDELAILVQAGFTPMEALQAATRNPARFLGKERDLGTIEKGKLADLVLLDANPLEDISNTQKIEAVVLAGRLIPKSELVEMLAKVEALASKKKEMAGPAAIALSTAFGSVGGAGSTQDSAKEEKRSGTIVSSKRLADGKEWTTANLNVNTSASYCYDDLEPNCRRYGRLYTWESAQRGCQSLGDRWRLPTDDEWRQMAKHYGGVGNDSPDKGKAAYTALLSGGTSGFNAVLGGNRAIDGKYDRLEAHGIYWTVSENDPTTAPLYNFGKGSQALYRGPQGQKQMAVSVRCVRE